MHKIQWKNTDKIQHKRYKNWTKYKYIDPRIWENATMSITNVKCITPIAPGAIVELKLDGVDEPAKASKFSIPDIATDLGKHASDMDCHISVVDHKTTRLCIALSAHGSTRAKCIRSNGRIQIRSNTKDARAGRNTTKIQHKRCSNWTKYKYIDPHSNRYACNRNTESTMGHKAISLLCFLK